MIYLVIGALAGSVIASIIVAALAAVELRRRDEALRALLDRVSTAPRLEIRAVEPAPKPDPATPKYISDEPYMDEKWNEYRGEPDGEDE